MKSHLLVLLVCFLALCLTPEAKKKRQDGEPYRFALIPKLAPHWFFDLANDGCQDAAEVLGNVECLYMGDPTQDAQLQAAVVRQAIEMQVDGIALSVVDRDLAAELVDESLEAGIPIITFDSDAAESNRIAYIGTDNFAFGRELGKLLEQLNPNGGKFGALAGDAPNLVARWEGVRDRLLNSDIYWEEVEDSPRDYGGEADSEPIAEMEKFVRNNPDLTAIVPVAGWPMVFRSTEWKAFVKSHRNLTLVSGDSNALQIELISSGFANGLVGQLPYEMGQLSMETLLNIVEGRDVDEVVFGTTLLEILRFPLVLPPLDLDRNYLGDLVIAGYVIFGLIAFFTFGFCFWMFVARHSFVIRAAQPTFLLLICLGTLILASTIFPLSIDDENFSQTQCDNACVAIPWTLSFGFTLIFSALFSKTWRINRFFHQDRNSFFVVKVSVADVVVPMAVLLILNGITLICWTVISPLEYERRNHDGTDGWNRIISTYGSCVAPDGTRGWVPYLVILLVINCSSLVFAIVQAYKARKVSVAFAETRYITFALALMIQACVVGIPLLFLVYDEPQDYYVVWMCLIAATCITLLFLIFVPKIWNRNMQRTEVTSSGTKTGSTHSPTYDMGE